MFRFFFGLRIRIGFDGGGSLEFCILNIFEVYFLIVRVGYRYVGLKVRLS